MAAPPPASPPAPRLPRPPETARELALRTTVTLDERDRPAGELFARLSRLSGVPVEYTPPPAEPRLSIRLTKGTAHEALRYLTLCGNLALTWTARAARVGPLPPPPPRA